MPWDSCESADVAGAASVAAGASAAGAVTVACDWVMVADPVCAVPAYTMNNGAMINNLNCIDLIKIKTIRCKTCATGLFFDPL